MRVVFSELAVRELNEAVNFYETEFSGLGVRFRGDVKRAAARVAEFPMAWSVEIGEVRKCLLHRFPYKLLYSVEAEHVFIIAVAHQHRRPNYWVERIEQP